MSTPNDSSNQPRTSTSTLTADQLAANSAAAKADADTVLYYGSKVGAFPYVKVGGGLLGVFHFTTDPKKDQKIPNTSATGDIFERPNDNDIFIKVDKKNNDLIQAYNKTALPKGWTAAMEFDKGPNYHNIYYQYNNGPKQVDRPLPSGWVRKMDNTRKFFYEHSSSGSWQYEYPLPPRWIEKMDTQNRKFHAVSNNPTITQYELPTQPVAAPASVSITPPSQTQTSSQYKDPCNNPYDLQDLYYYSSPKNGQGPYIPQQTNAAITDAARRTHHPSGLLFSWTHGIIPNTSATGCMSQDLGGYFGVQVDGLNKVIIDAYNATFPNGPPPVPLRPKYFYYIRVINANEEYVPRRLKTIQSDTLRNLEIDVSWGKSQQIPNTYATGFMFDNMKEGRAKTIYVRVDRANNAIIEAYNESLKTQLPPGWEKLKDNLLRTFYGNSLQKTVQWERPQDNPTPTAAATPAAANPTPTAAANPAAAPVATLPSTSLPPGWEELKDNSGRVYYGNPALKTTQYAFPQATTAPQPANVSAPLPPSKSPPPSKLPPSPSHDPDDLYYFISSNIGQSIGPYVPQREGQINDIARTEGTNSKTFITVIPDKPLDIMKAGPDRSSYTTWTPSNIPNTNATGWLSQNLNGRFAVRVDGVNKLIVDAYNAATFANPPTPVPLKPKYFYYTVNDKNGIQTYTSATLNNLKYHIAPRHGWTGDYWGEQKQIFNTIATGFMIPDVNSADINKWFGVRVDEKNAGIIMDYLQSISPLPPGWEQLREPSGVVYYKKDNVTQYDRPPPLPLPPGWVRKMDINQKFFYQNGTKWQYEYPLPTQPVAAATTPTTTQPTKVAATPAAPSVAVPAPSVAATPSVAVAAPSVEYYKVGDGDFPYDIVANDALKNAIKSVCPNDNSTCHIELVRADPKEQDDIKAYNTKIQTKTKGGAKKHRRTNRRTNRRNASRRTASHRTASHRTASRRTASRRTGKK